MYFRRRPSILDVLKSERMKPRVAPLTRLKRLFGYSLDGMYLIGCFLGGMYLIFFGWYVFDWIFFGWYVFDL